MKWNGRTRASWTPIDLRPAPRGRHPGAAPRARARAAPECEKKAWWALLTYKALRPPHAANRTRAGHAYHIIISSIGAALAALPDVFPWIWPAPPPPSLPAPRPPYPPPSRRSGWKLPPQWSRPPQAPRSPHSSASIIRLTRMTAGVPRTSRSWVVGRQRRGAQRRRRYRRRRRRSPRPNLSGRWGPRCRRKAV
jgi:hypothetical protein